MVHTVKFVVDKGRKIKLFLGNNSKIFSNNFSFPISPKLDCLEAAHTKDPSSDTLFQRT